MGLAITLILIGLFVISTFYPDTRPDAEVMSPRQFAKHVARMKTYMTDEQIDEYFAEQRRTRDDTH